MAEFVQIVKCPVEGDWDVSPDKWKWLFTITKKKITEREYKINQKSIACLTKIMKIWKQNLIINVFESLPFYFNYVDSTRSKRLSKMTYIYNMTTTPQKDFFPNCFLVLSKNKHHSFSGCNSWKILKYKNVCFSHLLI